MSYKVLAASLVLAVLPALATAQTAPNPQPPAQSSQTSPNTQAAGNHPRAAMHSRPVAGQNTAATASNAAPFIPADATAAPRRAPATAPRPIAATIAPAPPVMDAPVAASPVVAAAIPASSSPIAQPAAVQPAEASSAPSPMAAADYRQGLLTLVADHAPLGKVLELVAAKTGASFEVAPDLASELVAARLGPATPNEVLHALLDSPKLDYIILASGTDGSVQKVVVRRRQSFGRQPIGSFAASSQPAAGTLQPRAGNVSPADQRWQQNSAPAQTSDAQPAPEPPAEEPSPAPQENPPTA